MGIQLVLVSQSCGVGERLGFALELVVNRGTVKIALRKWFVARGEGEVSWKTGHGGG